MLSRLNRFGSEGNERRRENEEDLTVKTRRRRDPWVCGEEKGSLSDNVCPWCENGAQNEAKSEKDRTWKKKTAERVSKKKQRGGKEDQQSSTLTREIVVRGCRKGEKVLRNEREKQTATRASIQHERRQGSPGVVR